MPGFRFRSGPLRLPAVLLALAATAAAPPAVLAQTERVAAVENSALDAPLFYQLLLGEIQLRSGDPATAFQLLLDAARRSRDEAVFRRVTDIALQARRQPLVAANLYRRRLCRYAIDID